MDTVRRSDDEWMITFVDSATGLALGIMYHRYEVVPEKPFSVTIDQDVPDTKITAGTYEATAIMPAMKQMIVTLVA
jgi:hypothetical protein